MVSNDSQLQYQRTRPPTINITIPEIGTSPGRRFECGGSGEGIPPAHSSRTLELGGAMSDGHEEREELERRREQEQREDRDNRIDRGDADEWEPERVDS
jgi:hypothetical protein